MTLQLALATIVYYVLNAAVILLDVFLKKQGEALHMDNVALIYEVFWLFWLGFVVLLILKGWNSFFSRQYAWINGFLLLLNFPGVFLVIMSILGVAVF